MRDDWLKHPGYEVMFRAGADMNLAMSCLINPCDMGEVDRMCERFPQTPAIIDPSVPSGASKEKSNRRSWTLSAG